MSKTRSEAERLLNTIVSSRVRLSSLRGDPASTVEPTMDEEPLEQDTASTAAPVEQSSQEVAPEPPDRTALFADLPVNDDHTDFEPPPMVLGIDDPPDLDEDFAERETIEAQPLKRTPDLKSSDHDLGVQMIDLDSPEDDPFSFIDLIPPEAPGETPDDDARIQSAPPPVRTKPLMPLPTGLAAGAPIAKPEAAPAAVVAPLPTAEVPAETTAALSQPRRVEPRILDPERARLEVDVFVEEEDPEPQDHWDVDVPQLTDTVARTRHAPATPIRISEDALFDIITDAEAALERGDITTAASRFSDALDWQPSLVDARLSRGRCLRDMGDSAGAMSDFLKCSELAPHSPEPHVEIANLFFARKDYGRAVVHYTDALALDPGHAMAMCRRGICHHQRRHAAQALEDLRAAKALDASIPNIERYIQMVSAHRGTRPKR